MTSYELQLMRKLMFFSVAEAAEDISQTSSRTWQRWEKGDVPIPEDVAAKVCWYLEIQTAMVESYADEIERQLNCGETAYIPLIPSEARTSQLSELAVKNLHQSAVAELKRDYLQDLEIITQTN